LKEFKQKSHYDKHTNKKNPCINNIDKIKESFQIIINETIENKFNEIINKKLELSNNEQIKIKLNIDNNIIKQSLNNMEQLNKDKNDSIIQKKGLKRNTIDKYYTKTNIVEQCIEAMKKYINISKDDMIIEPSAGNGSFIESIKKITDNYKFYDLEPENKEIIKQDFLNFDFTEVKQKYKNIHIIGNPPFGRQASLAIKFIKHCCLFSNSISFILPKSFKKDSMKKHFSKNEHFSCLFLQSHKSFC
jgi:predicted RNA methylase